MIAISPLFGDSFFLFVYYLVAIRKNEIMMWACLRILLLILNYNAGNCKCKNLIGPLGHGPYKFKLPF